MARDGGTCEAELARADLSRLSRAKMTDRILLLIEQEAVHLGPRYHFAMNNLDYELHILTFYGDIGCCKPSPSL